MDDVAGKRSSGLLILAAWAVVVIPAAWGLSYTTQNAMKLFVKQPVTVVAPAAK